MFLLRYFYRPGETAVLTSKATGRLTDAGRFPGKDKGYRMNAKRLLTQAERQTRQDWMQLTKAMVQTT